MDVYRPRFLDRILPGLLADHPAVMVTGARATGKTTTAMRHAATVVRLDREAEAFAFRADPDAALRDRPEPVLLDEWQAVPEVLGAVKRLVDSDPRPGRFLLTGSVRAEGDAQSWPGVGRVIRAEMHPLTVAERLGRSPRPLVDRIVAGEPLRPPDDVPDLRGYLELALAGGFPEPAFARSAEASRRWYRSYADHLVTRDPAGAANGRDPARLRRFLTAVALNSAGIATERTLHEAAGINKRTGIAYWRFLETLGVVDAVPAWASNRLKRLTGAPKRYLADSGLLAAVARANLDAVLADGDLLGRMLDTLVAAQLRAEAAVAVSEPLLYHLRQEQGRREVDIVAEIGTGRVVGFEIKARAAPGPGDARHLRWLRDELGDRFLGGVVLHTGPHSYPLAERIVAAPIGTLWA